jgi:hypothetical protein
MRAKKKNTSNERRGQEKDQTLLKTDSAFCSCFIHKLKEFQIQVRIVKDVVLTSWARNPKV